MDRNLTISISKLANFGGLTKEDISILLTNYCVEHNKPHYETLLFITFLFEKDIYLSFFLEALEYYEKKYNIVKVQSRPDKLGQRQIIYIN